MKSGAIWMEMHALHKHGWTISALAREFGLNWRTVKRELESGEPRRYAERADGGGTRMVLQLNGSEPNS